MRRMIFGGTTEGRELAAQCAAQGDSVLVCVATEAGRRELPADIPCLVGRMEADEMARRAAAYGADELIDATHPFAEAAHRNIRQCAGMTGIPLRRVERRSDAEASFADAVIWADSAAHAAAILRREDGNILLATGSNTLKIYADALGVERLYVRVLPNLNSLQKCEEAGMPASHVIAMQGPFPADLNEALYGMWNIRHLVTKESGDVGGVREKVLPALKQGLNVVMIRRPGGI